ncbi:hypothetical protein INR49_009461, partial [Caranx melampygus]
MGSKQHKMVGHVQRKHPHQRRMTLSVTVDADEQVEMLVRSLQTSSGPWEHLQQTAGHRSPGYSLIMSSVKPYKL